MTYRLPAARPRTDGQLTLGRFFQSVPDSSAQVVARFAPQHYEAGYGYPLLIWLHGRSDNESQLRRVMPLLSMRNYVGAAPRLPQWPEGSPYQDDEWRDRVEAAVESAITTTQQQFHVRSDRIFLMGCHEAGTLALELALADPRPYAGVVSLGGPFPTGPHVLCRLEEARELPILLSVGTDSALYRQADICRDLRLFHAAGMTVSLRQYPAADELTTIMLEDANRWIMESIAGARLVS